MESPLPQGRLTVPIRCITPLYKRGSPADNYRTEVAMSSETNVASEHHSA